MSKKIAVIGAGISGMSSALLLAEQGHELHIIAKSFSPNITSNRAAAFWFPYHIRNDKRGIGWCRKSFDFYASHCSEATGISMKKLVKAVKKGTGDEDSWLDFMPEGTVKLLTDGAAPKGYDIAYETEVPLIETQLFLPWICKQLEAKGASFKQHEINDLHHLTTDYDAVINCSALGARELCNDRTVIPVRGQVVLLEPGFPDHIFLDNQTPSYIVPRKDATIVGGTYEENVFDERTEQASLDDILRRAYSVFEGLENRKIIGNWAGLRPFRPTVRLEVEESTNIIHNYGHGGSGYTLAFGCAGDVVGLVGEMKAKLHKDTKDEDVLIIKSGLPLEQHIDPTLAIAMKKFFVATYVPGDEESLHKAFEGLKTMGCNELLTMMLMMNVLGMGLGEAKMLVDGSPVWGYGAGHGYEGND